MRPFRRRLANTLRPAVVAMRVLNPDTRARFLCMARRVWRVRATWWTLHLPTSGSPTTRSGQLHPTPYLRLPCSVFPRPFLLLASTKSGQRMPDSARFTGLMTRSASRCGDEGHAHRASRLPQRPSALRLRKVPSVASLASITFLHMAPPVLTGEGCAEATEGGAGTQEGRLQGRHPQRRLSINGSSHRHTPALSQATDVGPSRGESRDWPHAAPRD